MSSEQEIQNLQQQVSDLTQMLNQLMKTPTRKSTRTTTRKKSVPTSKLATEKQIENHECEGDGESNKACRNVVKYRFSDGTFYCKKHHDAWVRYYAEGGSDDSSSESSDSE